LRNSSRLSSSDSRVTPWIAGDRWADPDLFDRVFPYDLHPQAHEIIRTWLFTEVLRSHLAPRVGIVLGSGLGAVADAVQGAVGIAQAR
jgi:hypothetical protein